MKFLSLLLIVNNLYCLISCVKLGQILDKISNNDNFNSKNSELLNSINIKERVNETYNNSTDNELKTENFDKNGFEINRFKQIITPLLQTYPIAPYMPINVISYQPPFQYSISQPINPVIPQPSIPANFQDNDFSYYYRDDKNKKPIPIKNMIQQPIPFQSHPIQPIDNPNSIKILKDNHILNINIKSYPKKNLKIIPM
mgnify:CR=1 FL=1